MDCPVNVDSEEWDLIKTEEAVVIREFEKGPDGQKERFGEIVAQGDAADMIELVDRHELMIVYGNVEFISQQFVLVKDLLGPTKGV